MGARVIIACKDRQKALESMTVLSSDYGIHISPTDMPPLQFMHLDLSSLDSVKMFAQSIERSHTPCNYLILNSGHIFLHRGVTKDGTLQLHFN
jgi:NAD(P)-dependent dehydrogenase (short-subunit alcohol dehydrogenase family)